MNGQSGHIAQIALAAAALITLAACGGSGSSPPPAGMAGSPGTDYDGTSSWPNTTHKVGGTVTNLVGQGLTIELQNLANLSHHTVVLEQMDIARNGTFIFSTPPPQDYGVAIVHQPQSPTQRCVVRNDRGTIGSTNVTDVGIVCGGFAYATNSTGDTVSVFAVNAATGAIVSSGPTLSAGQSPYAIASTPDKNHLYVANGASNNISMFAVEPSDGSLTADGGPRFSAGTNPRSFALYSAVTLGYGSPPEVNWYLYAANMGSNDLWGYHIDKRSGVLMRLPRTFTTGAGPSALLVDVGGPFLYASNAGGSNDISGFRIDQGSGDLTPLVGSPFPSGSKVSSMAFGVNGKFLYAADANNGAASIYGFSVDQDLGTLTALASFPYELPSCNFIVTDQTGAYLYATNGTNLFGYSIDAQSGALTLLPGFPVTVGIDANFMSIDPTDQYLYVRDGSTGTLSGFVLDGATGEVVSIPRSPFNLSAGAGSIATF